MAVTNTPFANSPFGARQRFTPRNSSDMESSPEQPLDPNVDPGLGGVLGVDGTLGAYPPAGSPRTRGRMGRPVFGASEIYDFAGGTYQQITSGDVETGEVVWILKDPPNVQPNEAGQLADLTEISQWLFIFGIDLHHAFTCLNIESFYSRPSKYNVQASFKGPFQYGQAAMNTAFGTKGLIYDLFDIETQCSAFANDQHLFVRLLKEVLPNVPMEPWMSYMMHQQGPWGGRGMIRAWANNSQQSLWDYTRANRIAWRNITGQASALLAGNNPRNLTVTQYVQLFLAFYTKHWNGTIRQPVTDYIEAVPVTRGSTEAVELAAADVIETANEAGARFFINPGGIPKTALDYVIPGEGIDITVQSSQNAQPAIIWKGPLRKAYLEPNRIIMLDLWWDKDGPPNRTIGGFGIGPCHFVYSETGAPAYGGFQIKQTYYPNPESPSDASDMVEKIQSAEWNNVARDLQRVRGYDIETGDFIEADWLPMEYGDARLAWRRTTTSITICTNAMTDPLVISAPMTFQPEPQDWARQGCFGYMKIRRVYIMPDSDDPAILKKITRMHVPIL